MSLRTMDFFGLPVTFRVEMRKNTAAIILSLRSRDKERIDGNGAIVYEHPPRIVRFTDEASVEKRVLELIPECLQRAFDPDTKAGCSLREKFAQSLPLAALIAADFDRVAQNIKWATSTKKEYMCWFELLVSKFGRIPFCEITQEKFALHLREGGYSDYQINGQICAMRALVAYEEAQYLISEHFIDTFTMGNRRTVVGLRDASRHFEKNILTHAQVERIAASCVGMLEDNRGYLYFGLILLPIVCFENEFKDPCRGPDYSNFAFKLLKEFGVSSEQLGFSLLDEFDNLTPSDSHPPMRILRRNFATVIQACTDLSLEEKEYIFGHRISGKDGAKKRIEYNRNMDRLWRIAQKLDKAPFCKKLYELHFPQIIVGDGIVVQEGRGQGTIRIPWESAVYGQKLHLHFEGGPNTSVSISTPNAVRPFGGLPVEVKMADAPISWGDPLPPINAEAMHWEAVRKVRYLKKTDK